MAVNTDINETLRDAEFKDEKPVNTVEKIRGILHNHGIETEEIWSETQVPYCYAIRVNVKGTSFGTNGKGLTREFARASGYGELMERLQLGFVTRDETQKDGSFSSADSRAATVPARELLERNRKWYELYSQRLSKYSGVQLSPEAIVNQYADADGNVRVTLYYHTATQAVAYLPEKLWKTVYTANGCAAGNTAEEATVQAISEIVERHHQLKILTEQIAVPNIPEEVLQQYPTAYSIITYLRGNGFQVFVKDCSLGEKYPVVCLVLISQKTGKYHTHFGAYPIFEIALERALTESFQGRNIENVAKYTDFAYDQQDVLAVHLLTHELVKGAAEKKPDFFYTDAEHPWNDQVGFSGKNNAELVRECVAFFQEQGHDVLIRDCSCLGFPTYQVLVPGYSEVFAHRISQEHNDFRYASYAEKALRNPSAAQMDDFMGLFLHLNALKQMDKSINVHGFTRTARISANPSSRREKFIMAASLAYAYFAVRSYKAVIPYLDAMLESMEGEDESYIICLKRYLSLKLRRYDDRKIKELMELFHGSATVNELYSCLAAKRNPLERFTLHCDVRCDETCQLYACCCQHRAHELAQLIAEKSESMDSQASMDILKQILG